MKKFMMTAVIAGLTATLGLKSTLAQEDRVLELPPDYRTTFTQYYSGNRFIEAEQTIRIFANDIAVQGAKAGGALPDGAILVAEVYAAQKDADGDVIESFIGERLDGEFKAIAMMERRAGWDDQYPAELKVGNWEFDVFSADGKNLGKDTTACRECHHPLTDTDYTFSVEHLIAAVRR